MKFIPRPYQSAIIDWIKSNDRSAVFANMGSGKTVCTLTALDTYPILIIAPLRVAGSTWPDEVKKWPHLQHLKCSVITGTLKQRTEALNSKADVYTTNFESLPWLVDTLQEKWPFRTVVVDESTKLKGFRTRQGSKRAKALAKVSHSIVNKIVLLTGTPAPNGLLDLWGQLWFIDQGQRLEKSYGRYCDKHFNSDYMGYNFTPKRGAQEEIQSKIQDVCLTIKVEDWMPVDEPLVNIINVSMPAKAAKLYKQMERDMFVQLEKEGVEAMNAATVCVKCAQIANGAIYRENATWEVLHDEKISALASIIEEANGMPVLVSYRFKSDLSRLRAAFPHGKALGGSDEVISLWNTGKIPVLFVHPKSAGHGLNLQDGSNTLAFFSIDWNLEEHLQVIERIGPLRQKQSGHNRAVHLHYILTKGTIDELIMERLSSKKSVQEVLLDAMKRNR